MVPQRFNVYQMLLHWVLAGLIILSLTFGLFYLRTLPSDSAKIAPLRLHMVMGLAIGVLIIVSLCVRIFTRQPDPLKSGRASTRVMAVLVHAVLRICSTVMVVSGIALSIQAGLFATVIIQSGKALPHDFLHYLPHQVHAVVAKILVTAIALHTVATLFHHLARVDKPFTRMGWGK